MHKIYYKGIQYATSYSSASIYINYPDPVIHLLDYYSDIIDSRRGENREKSNKQLKQENDNVSQVECEGEGECECYYHDYMDYYDCDACKEKAKSKKPDELFNLQYV